MTDAIYRCENPIASPFFALGQNLTTWDIGRSNQVISRRILQYWTEDRSIFQLEKSKSEARNRIAKYSA